MLAEDPREPFWVLRLQSNLRCILVATILLSVVAAAPPSVVAQTPIARTFSPPLGYRDGLKYAPRIAYFGGNLIENTSYGVHNPDLQGPNCFGADFRDLYHAGEDWYRVDGQTTLGAEITAVADGTVWYVDPALNWPGRAVIIEHVLGDGRKIYSVYIHIDPTTFDAASIVNGRSVTRGQRLGTVVYYPYSGRYPDQHPSGDDSHLHYEIRYFDDASHVYSPAYPACDGRVVGAGYTYPGLPDSFPAPSSGYTDPATFVRSHGSTWFPVAMKNYAMLPQGDKVLVIYPSHDTVMMSADPQTPALIQ